MSQIVANLNGGDNITPDNELIFKIYGDADNYTTAIAITENAINDANVSVSSGVVTIANVDVTGQGNVKLTSIDAEGNESSQSVAFVVPTNLFENAAAVGGLVDLGFNYTGDVVRVKNDLDVYQNFTLAQIQNGDLDTFANGGNLRFVYFFNHLDGTQIGVEPADVDKPLIYENGIYKGAVVGSFRTLEQHSVNTDNILTTIVSINDSRNNTFINYQSGIFFVMRAKYGIDYKIDLETNNSTETTILQTSFESDINMGGITVFTGGFQNGDVNAKLNTENIQSATATGGGVRTIDENLSATRVLAYIRHENVVSASKLNDIHLYLKNKYDLIEPRVATGFPVTTVTPDTDTVTGIAYDYDLNEILVAWSRITGAGDVPVIKRYSAVDFSFVGQIELSNIASGTIIQDILYFNNLYWVGDNGYDVNGNLVDTFVLPFTPLKANQTDYHNGSIWAIEDNRYLKEFEYPSMNLLSTFDMNEILLKYNMTGFYEGLAVFGDYIAVSIGRNKFYLFDKTTLRIVGKISGVNWTEGLTFDSNGNLYQNQNRGFHDGEVNGNITQKYILD